MSFRQGQSLRDRSVVEVGKNVRLGQFLFGRYSSSQQLRRNRILNFRLH